MPSYGGVNLFGLSPRCRTAINPRALQKNAFFGVNGVQGLDGGQRGRVTSAEGVLFGADVTAITVAVNTMESYIDNVARDLVDSYGRLFPFVYLRSFEPGERILADDLGYYMTYRATFEHLI